MHLPARFAVVILTLPRCSCSSGHGAMPELLLIGAIPTPGQRTVTSLCGSSGQPGAAVHQLPSGPEPGRLERPGPNPVRGQAMRT